MYHVEVFYEDLRGEKKFVRFTEDTLDHAHRPTFVGGIWIQRGRRRVYIPSHRIIQVHAEKVEEQP